jgi:hypothetical protein
VVPIVTAPYKMFFVNNYLMNREAMTGTIQKLDQSTTPASSIPKVIVRAEPTLARILKTLDADYVKVQVRCATYSLLWAKISCFITKNKLLSTSPHMSSCIVLN